MKHDFRAQPDGENAERFLSWLAQETEHSLRQAGDIKAAVFLYVNRAYEAHMPEAQISEVFGQCVARAGVPDESYDALFGCFEQMAQLAAAVHGKRPRKA